MPSKARTTNVVHVRLHPDLARVLHRAAAELGLSDGSYYRLVLARSVIGGSATEEEVETRWPGTTHASARAGLPALARAVAQASKGRMTHAQALAALLGTATEPELTATQVSAAMVDKYLDDAERE